MQVLLRLNQRGLPVESLGCDIMNSNPKIIMKEENVSNENAKESRHNNFVIHIED